MAKICKQPQALSKSLQELVRIPKDSLWKINLVEVSPGSQENSKRQNWIQDKFNFYKTHIRRKSLSKYSRFKSPQRGVSVSAVLAHDIHEGPQIMTIWSPACTLRQHTCHPFEELPIQVYHSIHHQSISRSWINLAR